jgi:hypothetical protein
MRASNAADTNWVFFDYDPVTFKTIYTKFENGLIHIRETIPQWLAEQYLEENKQKAKLFDENGGWKGAKQGAVIANVPDHIDKEFKRLSGWDPTKSGWYDKDKYNSFLDDPDYAALRTGGGKIGRKKAEVVKSTAAIKKVIQCP